MSPRTLAIFAGIGIVIALHWIAFFASIKLANASVAAACMGVAPLIMSVVEPLITRRRFEPMELLIGIVAIPGVVLVVGGTPDAMRAGVAVGILSAFLVAVFGSLNKRHIAAGEPLAVTGLELASGTAFMTLLVLAFVFASWMAIVPLLMALVAIPTTFLAVWPLASATDVSVIVKVLIALVGLAIAIDYALLVVVRWREERQRESTTNEAAIVRAARAREPSIARFRATVNNQARTVPWRSGLNAWGCCQARSRVSWTMSSARCRSPAVSRLA